MRTTLALATTAAGLTAVIIQAESAAAATVTTLIPYGATWAYRDSATAPASNWTAETFDDASWKRGRAQLGYGDGDERTILSYGADAANKPITTWYRAKVNITSPAAFTSVALGVLRDDGVRVFINGIEVMRDNLPATTITSTTKALVGNLSETVPVQRTLPVNSIKAGTNTIAVEIHQNTEASSDISFDLTLRGVADGVTPPPNQIVAVGDMAPCGSWWATPVSQLIASIPGVFAPLGDLAYPNSSPTNFTNCYHPYFGQFNNRVRPVIGNHEYKDPNAAGYFGYFGTKGGSLGNSWYSYDTSGWHIVVLDSECWAVGGCGIGSPQYNWLKSNLAASTTACLGIMWHRPRYTSSTGAVPETSVKPMYDLAMSEGADFLLSGHAHGYERFTRMDSNGAWKANGIRQFVVGTGGGALYTNGTPQPGSTVRNTSTYGALRLTLTTTGYTWKFMPVEGMTFTDSGSDQC